MVSSLLPRGVQLAGALLLSACTIQRAPAMSRRATDEPATAKPAAVSRAAVDPADTPVAGSRPMPGSEIVRVHATVQVRTPLTRVREVLLDCPRYPSFLSNYRACTDLGPAAHSEGREGRAWRMEIVELGGLIKLRVHIEMIKVSGGDAAEVYEGRLVEGNIRSFSSRWRLETTPAGFTRLTLESHLDPKLPLPNSLINDGSVDGIRDAIMAIKRRAEHGPEASAIGD